MTNPSFIYFRQQLKPLLFVLVVSAIGFLLNLYPIPLFSNVHLILGNVAFVIIAMRFGILYSLLSFKYFIQVSEWRESIVDVGPQRYVSAEAEFENLEVKNEN